MGPDWIRIAALTVIAALGCNTFTARADDTSSWLKERRTRFAAFRAAQPNPDTQIAGIKARTAALIAAYAPDSDPVLDHAPVIWRVSDTPVELWDGPEYPEMIVVPAGEYTMGSPASEPNRQANEGPRHRVRVGYSLAVSKYSVTVGEYRRFVVDTQHDVGEACFTIEHGEYRLRGARDYQRVGYRQTSNGPVGCVNWFDAQAYVAWLSKKTGHTYRLLSEAEYEYLNRAGTISAYWWGEDIGTNRTVCDGCGSVWDKTRLAVIGSFAPNAFGLYDTTGNNWSWLSDCWNATYAGAPADGSANTNGDCDLHVMRGGGERSPYRELRSASRSRHWFSLRNIVVGFRVAQTL
jgi:formylglycine-generating enzyme required for sulfatase activity